MSYLAAQKRRKVLIVDDVLPDCNHNSTSLFKECIFIPVWIQERQLDSDSIVLNQQIQHDHSYLRLSELLVFKIEIENEIEIKWLVFYILSLLTAAHQAWIDSSSQGKNWQFGLKREPNKERVKTATINNMPMPSILNLFLYHCPSSWMSTTPAAFI